MTSQGSQHYPGGETITVMAASQGGEEGGGDRGEEGKGKIWDKRWRGGGARKS